MKTLLLLALSLQPLFAQAGSLTDKAYQVAAQLGSREPVLSQAQRADVNRQLDALLAGLSGQNPSRSYLCVSRDNDNHPPYAMAYKDFATVTRISGATYASNSECEQSLAAAQQLDDHFFVCASRDNDGSRPYKIVALSGAASAAMLQRSVLGSLDDCLSATRTMQIRPEGVLYCGSKDNDGSFPYAQTGLRRDGTFALGSDDFRSLEECEVTR